MRNASAGRIEDSLFTVVNSVHVDKSKTYLIPSYRDILLKDVYIIDSKDVF